MTVPEVSVQRRMLRLAVPIGALVAVLALAAPAWASTVQIQDDAHVLNATAVQNEAATLPVGVYVWAITQDAASKSTFDTDVRNKVNATFPVVLAVVVFAVIVVSRRRRRSGFRMGPPLMGSGPPPMDSYGGYGPGYRSGMSPGAAGAMGAVGGGLLGYELGKMQGENQQYRQDEPMDRGGQYDYPDQGNWVVGQDGDFGGGSDASGSSGGSGDW